MTLPESFSRRNLLRAMLAALAFSALAGVAIVILPGAAYTWRLFIMAIVTAVACVVLMGSGALLKGDRAQPAGLFALALIVVVYALAVAAVWAGLFWRSLDEKLALTALSAALCGLPLIPALRFREGRNDNPPIALLAFAAAVALVALTLASFLSWGSTQERCTATGFVALAWGSLTCACLFGVPNQLAFPWRWIGVLGALAATAMMLYGIWIARSDDPTWVTLAYALAATPAYANIVRRIPLAGWARWVRIIGIIAFGASGAVLVVAVNDSSPLWTSDPMWRVFTGLLIITGACTMGMLVLALLHRRVVAKDAPVGAFTTMQLVCPRCASRHTAPVGDSACPHCRLRFTLRVQLPVCPNCEYDLSDIRGDKCPECGAPIAPTSATAP